MNKKEYNKIYRLILIDHLKSHKKLSELIDEKDLSIRGIALSNSRDLKVATDKIKNSLEYSYKLTKIEELLSPIKTIDGFIKEPIISLFVIYTMTNKRFIKSMKKLYNVDIENAMYKEHGTKYDILKNTQIFLNSACQMEHKFIEKSLQIYLALLQKLYTPNITNEEMNDYINLTCENIIESHNLDIEFPQYTLGVISSENVKIKTIFCKHILLEVNSKSKKVMPYDTELFINTINDVNDSQLTTEQLLFNTFS